MIGRLKFWFVAAIFGTLPLFTLALLSRPAAAAGLWYVAPSGDDTHDCLTTVTPCATINGAIGKAAPGDTIRLAIGVYTSTTGSEVVSVTKSISLSGGWDGTFETQGGTSTIDASGGWRGIDVPSGVTVTIEYVTAKNGNVGNFASGGGIRNFGTLILSHAIVSGNTSANGGGIYNGAKLTLNNSVVSGNLAWNGGSGGGITNNFGTVTVNNSTIRGNSSVFGGGIDNSNGSLTLNNSNVIANTSSDGGGIFNENNGTLTVNNSTVSGNSSGGISNMIGTLTLNNSTVSGNAGSGIYNTTVLILNNSTISGNTASDDSGGGIHSNGGTVTLNSSTVSGNAASGVGGIDVYNSGTATLANSILAGNTSYSGFPDPDGCGLASAGYNLFGVISGCNFTPVSGDMIGVDPKLDTLQDNGGPAATQALLPGSAAINAGNPGGCFGSNGLLATDERGYPRLGRCDIGAFEAQPIEASDKSVNRPSALPGQPLQYTIILANAGAAASSTVVVTDTLPAGVNYANGSLTATSGTYNYSAGVITWTGSLDASAPIAIQFQANTLPNASLGTVLTNTAIISGAGELFTRRAVTTLALAKLFLPLMYKPLPGIQGYVTFNGAPAASVFLELRQFNGQSFSTQASGYTDANGFYDFLPPSLPAGAFYYVRYLNHQTDATRLSFWGTANITSFTAGGSYGAGNFDLANVDLASPANSATVALPALFQWVRRAATSSDSYQFSLFDPNGNAFAQTGLLGYVNGVTINSVPSDFHSGTQYGWFVAIDSPDGGYGESYYYYQITFSNILAGSQPSVAGGAQVSPAKPRVDRPRP